jgi:hypothetical protein
LKKTKLCFLVQKYFFLKKAFLNIVFFGKCKISSFSKNEFYDHKIHRQGSLGSKLPYQSVAGFFTKTQHLMILAKFMMPSQIFVFRGLIFEILKILGNRQTQKKKHFFHRIEKFM